MPAVNPHILIWAREAAGLDLPTAADKLNINDSQTASGAEKLGSYEAGDKAPSRSLLLRMSKVYRRSLLIFYLSEPPEIANRGEDYRTLSGETDPAENAVLDALLRNVRARQEIVRAALISEQDSEPLGFIGSYNVKKSPAKLAKIIIDSFSISLDVYRGTKSQMDAFGYLRSCIEETGIFTLLIGNLGSHHSNLSTDIFRGFALSDTIAPFVVVNDRDAKSAWSMTLLHEVTHLWLGETGVSGGKIERKVEKFCEEVASEILLPESDLENIFDFSTLAEPATAIVSIDSLASSYKVSSRLVAYRLLKRKSISQDQYRQLASHFHERWQREREKQKEKYKKNEGGPSYYVIRKHRVGQGLVNTSERLWRSGELSTTKAAAVLGVRALKIDKMFANSRNV